MKKVKTSVSYPSAKEDRTWEAQDALRTLTRTKEIQGDSNLMKLVQAEHKNQSSALASIGKDLSGKVPKKGA